MEERTLQPSFEQQEEEPVQAADDFDDWDDEEDFEDDPPRFEDDPPRFEDFEDDPPRFEADDPLWLRLLREQSRDDPLWLRLLREQSRRDSRKPNNSQKPNDPLKPNHPQDPQKPKLPGGANFVIVPDQDDRTAPRHDSQELKREKGVQIEQTQRHLSDVRREKDSQIHLEQHLSNVRRECQQLQQHLSDVRKEKDSQTQQLQQHLSDLRREKDSQMQQLQQHLSDVRKECQQLQQHLYDLRREKDSQTQQLQQHLSELRREKDSQTQQLQQHLSDVRREKDVQIEHLQQHLSDIRRECQHLQERLGTTVPPTHSQEVEFWRVSPEEVQVNQHEILGGGAWGYVAKGKFRGQIVAVKRVYPSILQPATVDRIRREISTMAQVRHPNLVLFIAAVLDDPTGPMIITEILDTNLRTAYEENRLGSSKVQIFQDIASALNYLHLHREPIIHRDVSTPNVLLQAVANNMWKAKLSDFGSANLVRYATTPGEGAIIYTAPEAFPQPPTSPTPPPPQTPKIDVYSYGVLLGEVVTQELPDPSRLQGMVQQVRRQWPQIHPLVTGCIQHSPESRPTMAYILEELDKLMP